MSEPKEFRLDINALRALAVGLVTLHHFRVPGFEAGFVGVDIFFVISGYLMTKIAVDAADKGRFSVLAFYWARVKRIVPAIVALCAVLLAAGYMLLLPSDYRLLAKHVGSSLGFFSNAVFSAEAGYFDVASHDKWLLHTWSLSVEWQFYLLFPLLMAALLRWLPQRHWLVAVGLAALAGFVYCHVRAAGDPTSAFFLLPARAWEMSAGAWVLLFTRCRRGTPVPSWVAPAGLALLALAMPTIDTRTAWPGAMTAIPVVGTMLLLAGTLDGWVVRHAAVQAVGRWSYSIYLWHWPVVVAMAYLAIEPGAAAILVGVGLSLALGALSYRWVEVPSRRGLGALGLHPRAVALLAGWIGLVGVSAAVYLTDGARLRSIPEAARLADDEKANNVRHDRTGSVCRQPTDGTALGCTYGQGPVGAVLVGDSHSSAVVTAVAEAAGTRNASVLHYSFDACPIVEGITHLNKRFASCPRFITDALRHIAGQPVRVPLIVVNRWSAYVEGRQAHELEPGQRFIQFSPGESEPVFLDRFATGLAQTLCPIAQSGRRVIVVKPIPEMPFSVPNRMARTAMMTKRSSDVALPWAEYQRRHTRTLAILEALPGRCGIELLDPTEALCMPDGCLGSVAGRPLYVDAHHLGEFGNKRLVPMFRQALGAPAKAAE